MTFNLDTLQAELAQMPACTVAVVGFSGGLDSVVLLHSLVQLRDQSRLPFSLRALHVNHGLHAQAGTWERQCRQWCQAWGVTFVAHTVTVNAAAPENGGAGIENAARDARYGVYRAELDAGAALLLAHHRDDQMETVLLRLMRGAGPRGLAGMPRQRKLGAGTLVRPLLAFDRRDLEDYARAAGLDWIEDTANAELQFDRNYCRHQILPLLEARWPGYRESWSKSAALAAEAETLLQELAALDLQRLQGTARDELPLAEVLALSEARQRNLLRAWLVNLGLPEPGWKQLHTLSEQLLAPRAEGYGVMPYHGMQLCCLRDRLLVMAPPPPIDLALTLDWNPAQQSRCELPGNGWLVARPGDGSAADRRLAIRPGPVQVQYREHGSFCQLRGRPRKSLKKILQEAGVEPWFRDRLPLLYGAGELLLVPGIGAAEAAPGMDDGAALVIEWQRPQWDNAEE